MLDQTFLDNAVAANLLLKLGRRAKVSRSPKEMKSPLEEEGTKGIALQEGVPLKTPTTARWSRSKR